jgi:ATP-dependent NAD(P)H-hydrate dehydratase
MSSTSTSNLQLRSNAGSPDYSRQHSNLPQILATHENFTAHHVMAIDEIKSEVKRVVPALSDDKYKGQCGKVAVVGGCTEYTGQPYFCAISALKVGVDISHIFCSLGAAPIIKGYSPEVFVHPYLMETSQYRPGELTEQIRVSVVLSAATEIEAWFSRLDCLVVGPGLGRDPLMLDVARAVILRAREALLPLVLDGDALFLVAREPELVKGYSQCLLTPNLNEFRRLASTMGVGLHGPNNDRIRKIHEVVIQLGGPTLVSKGPLDVVSDTQNVVVCSTTAGARRCSFQGDILAGALAAFVAWTRIFVQEASSNEEIILPEMNSMLLAGFGGCTVCRTASACTFQVKKRSMLAGDMVESLGTAVEMMFEMTGGNAGASQAMNEMATVRT